MKATRLIKAGKIVTVSSAGTIINGGIAIAGGRILAVGPWEALLAANPDAEILDYGDRTVTPGLVDPHVHTLEYGGGTALGAGELTQLVAGAALLVGALRAGVTTVGEQLLGHYLYRRPIEAYKEAVKDLPLNVAFAVGTCTVATEPITYLSALNPGKPLAREQLLDRGMLRELAGADEAPGEHVIVNASPANLPLEYAPHAGERVFSTDDMKVFINAYHAEGKRAGAHLEGRETISAFVELGGDVVHHGHRMPPDILPKMAIQGIGLVATPSGGTSSRPNSPEEIAAAVEAGVTVSLASDAVLPLHPEVTWYDLPSGACSDSPQLAYLAAPAMRLLAQRGVNENDILSLITLNGAKHLGLDSRTGSIEPGKQADLLVAKGIPGLEITDPGDIHAVLFKGETAFQR